jgi:hypothetical protein
MTERSRHPNIDALVEEERRERETFRHGRKANGHDKERHHGGRDDGATAGSLDPLWRAIRALRCVTPVKENFAVVAGALLGTREQEAEQVFKAWTEPLANEEKALASRVWEETRAAFGDKPAAPPEGVYRLAFAARWRWPIVFSANRLDEMADDAEHHLVRAGAEIYQLDNRLVRPVQGKVSAANNRQAAVAQLLPVTPSYLRSGGRHRCWFQQLRSSSATRGSTWRRSR